MPSPHPVISAYFIRVPDGDLYKLARRNDIGQAGTPYYTGS